MAGVSRVLVVNAGSSSLKLSVIGPSEEVLDTTTAKEVGSYPVPDWLVALPSQQALIDATRVVFKTQEMAGIDVVADGAVPVAPCETA